MQKFPFFPLTSAGRYIISSYIETRPFLCASSLSLSSLDPGHGTRRHCSPPHRARGILEALPGRLLHRPHALGSIPLRRQPLHLQAQSRPRNAQGPSGRGRRLARVRPSQTRRQPLLVPRPQRDGEPRSVQINRCYLPIIVIIIIIPPHSSTHSPLTLTLNLTSVLFALCCRPPPPRRSQRLLPRAVRPNPLDVQLCALVLPLRPALHGQDPQSLLQHRALRPRGHRRA